MTPKHIAIAHPGFDQYVLMCFETPELVKNFNRLYGANLNFVGRQRSGIEMMIDKACGSDGFNNKPEDVRAFLDFVCDTFLRLPELQDDFHSIAKQLETKVLS